MPLERILSRSLVEDLDDLVEEPVAEDVVPPQAGAVGHPDAKSGRVYTKLCHLRYVPGSPAAAGHRHYAAEQGVQVQGFSNAEADLAHAGGAISNASATTVGFGSVSQFGIHRDWLKIILE